jgi:hypothetical protein
MVPTLTMGGAGSPKVVVRRVDRLMSEHLKTPRRFNTHTLFLSMRGSKNSCNHTFSTSNDTKICSI